MKALIIYDATGRIWNVTYGEDILPTGLSGMVADVPEGRSVYGIDFPGASRRQDTRNCRKRRWNRYLERLMRFQRA